MATISIIDTGYKSYSYEKKLFKKNGYNLQIYHGSTDPLEKFAFCKDSIGILVRGTPIDAAFLNATPKLKVIVRYGTGYDNLNLEEAKKRGIRIANVRRYATQSVSDHALALILSCTRMLSVAPAHMHKAFGTPPEEDIFELHDKTLGIIGLGKIGSALSQKAKPLFKKIVAYDPYIKDSDFKNARAVKSTLDKLLSESHVISLHCNLTDETNHILNPETFSKMKKKPIIVNTSRGSVIDTLALLNALNHGKIHSAGLDVFEHEHDEMHHNEKILHHPRIQCSGHYAWYSDASSRELQQRAANNMIALLNGEEIDDLLI